MHHRHHAHHHRPAVARPKRDHDQLHPRVRAGGQNVNKVSTAAQLRFDLMRSPSLPSALKMRAADLAGSRLTTEGEIVITADRHRTQAMNRDDALTRLIEMLREAAVPPKPRRATRPTRASKERRLVAKKERGGVKKLRQSRPED